jgi:Leucine-rich repeat (LRR) protein
MGVGSSKPLSTSNEVAQDIKQWEETLEPTEKQDAAIAKEHISKCYRKKQRALVLCDLHLPSLPCCVWRLTHLKRLILPYNQLVEISPIINSLHCLTLLDISHNTLTHLPELPGLSRLKTLLAQHNELRMAPASLCQLPHLTQVDMTGNENLTLPYVLKRHPLFYKIKNDSLASLQHIYKDLKRILIDENVLDEEIGHISLIINPTGEDKEGKEAFACLLKKLEVRDTLTLSQTHHIIDFTRRINTILKKMIKNPEIRENMYVASLPLYQTILEEKTKLPLSSEALDILQLVEQIYSISSFKANTLTLLLEKSSQLFAIYRAEEFIENYYAEVKNIFKSKSHFRINIFYRLKGYFEYYGSRITDTNPAYISAFNWAGMIGSPQYISDEQCELLVRYVLYAKDKHKKRFAEALYAYPFWQAYLQKGYQQDPTVTHSLYTAFVHIDKLSQGRGESTEETDFETEEEQEEAAQVFSIALASHL